MTTGAREEYVDLYWWSKKKNFGDLLGPWMIAMLTGMVARNVRDLPPSSGAIGIATVGSLVHSLDRPGLSIWGSGSICRLAPKHIEALASKRPNGIYALRGKLTRAEVVKKLGWEAPEVYGDPALLLPRVYEPRFRQEAQGKLALVPHYSHKKFIDDVPDSIHVVEVQDEPDVVVDQIASADYCVSTSLHGIIVAQAYEVPWVWLRVSGERLLGGDFKFEDFFSVLDRDAVKALTVDPGANVAELAAAIRPMCNIPQVTADMDDLFDSFPLDVVV